MPPDRRSEIAANLARVRERIAAAAVAAGRDPAQIHLIAVTKTYPVADVLHLAALGVTDVGENRDQEAAPKAAAAAAAGAHVCWHFVGQLQRNKCRSVAGYAVMVHSVDRVSLVTALSAARARLDLAPLDVLIQVNLDRERAGERGGASPDGVADLARAVDAAPALRLRGVMAVAPLGDGDREEAFGVLAGVAARLRRDHPQAALISAGMSGDLEAAIRHGATHVRIGTALLGTRPRLG